MENQQPTGEAKNSQTMMWYKKPWMLPVYIFGFIILLVLIVESPESLFITLMLVSLGCFLISWIFPNIFYKLFRKESKALVRTTFGIAMIIFFVAFGITLDKNESNNQKETTNKTQEANLSQTQKTETENPRPKAPQLPKFVFDIPVLIGKDIDEVVQSLGSPSSGKEPTKQQLATGVADEWYKEFTKDDVTVLVTYNAKTKVVLDFFFDGENKTKIMEAGNLKENSGDYNLELVKNITDPNKITGIKVSQKLPSELDANVTYSSNAFKIENKENYNWSGCKFEINGGGKIFSGGYEYKSSTGIKAKDSIIIPFSEFTKDSQRFNFYSEKPENLFISCNTNGQSRTNYFAIK